MRTRPETPRRVTYTAARRAPASKAQARLLSACALLATLLISPAAQAMWGLYGVLALTCQTPGGSVTRVGVAGWPGQIDVGQVYYPLTEQHPEADGWLRTTWHQRYRPETFILQVRQANTAGYPEVTDIRFQAGIQGPVQSCRPVPPEDISRLAG